MCASVEMRWKFCAAKLCSECGPIFARSAESKIAHFLARSLPEKIAADFFLVGIRGTLQLWFPPLRFNSPAITRFAVDNEFQPAAFFVSNERVPIPIEFRQDNEAETDYSLRR
jgi:hypothetical protein